MFMHVQCHVYTVSIYACFRQTCMYIHEIHPVYMYICLLLQRDYEEKDAEIERLRRELEEARRSAATSTPPTIVVARKPSPHNSPPQFRPHSCHVADLAGSLSQPAMVGDMVGLVSLPSDPGT